MKFLFHLFCKKVPFGIMPVAQSSRGFNRPRFFKSYLEIISLSGRLSPSHRKAVMLGACHGHYLWKIFKINLWILAWKLQHLKNKLKNAGRLSRDDWAQHWYKCSRGENRKFEFSRKTFFIMLTAIPKIQIYLFAESISWFWNCNCDYRDSGRLDDNRNVKCNIISKGWWL